MSNVLEIRFFSLTLLTLQRHDDKHSGYPDDPCIASFVVQKIGDDYRRERRGPQLVKEYRY